MSRSVTIALPIASRRAACDFYRDALDLELVGPPAEDGMPEPLQFALDLQTRLMLVPTGGFEWVVGQGRVAPASVSECLLGVSVPDEAGVTALFAKCLAAGATAVRAPERMPWGFEALISDPDGHLWTIVAEPAEPA